MLFWFKCIILLRGIQGNLTLQDNLQEKVLLIQSQIQIKY